ncbi:MAG: 16S rRNA (cytosine(1402)-N(4))-methyltransferase RsmH [Bacteroidales bacterium]|nr:16S rRNA (cytosine(1402)-N(4))-methyltransferase RsmH [Bacteroidales bacterium]MDD4822188.1 16S rRNA (cytosine(1402)-N(4))-methyltransferase RsmH [Bacteroidales bacterium]
MNESLLRREYHIPALLPQCMEGLNIHKEGTYVDVTFGGGGHSREILSRLDKGGSLYAFDQDEDAEKNCPKDKRFTFIRGNFRYLSNFMHYHKVEAIDGLLADLGVSSHHFDDPSRGFSFRFEGALDMRMNKRAGQTAADVLNEYPEEELASVFYLYGELKNSRKIAAEVVRRRGNKKFETIADFLEILRPLTNRDQEKKNLAQAFQALRIEVNGEMDALIRLLKQAEQLLKPNGRLVIISYHSLEDRLVKNFLKSGNAQGDVEKDFFGNIQSPFRLINNKVIVPDDEECARNPRARSAKLRIAEKK